MTTKINQDRDSTIYTNHHSHQTLKDKVNVVVGPPLAQSGNGLDLLGGGGGALEVSTIGS